VRAGYLEFTERRKHTYLRGDSQLLTIASDSCCLLQAPIH